VGKAGARGNCSPPLPQRGNVPTKNACFAHQEVTKRLPMRGDRDLLVWMPLKDEFDLADPLTSTYTSSFRQNTGTSCCDRDVRRQKYVPTLGVVYKHHPHETTYRYDIGQYNPHRRPPPTVRANNYSCS